MKNIDNNSKKIDLVVCGYLIENDNILLIHHKKLDMWLPVGGHIDKNETPDNALIREYKEETNLDIELLNMSKKYDKNIKYNVALPVYTNVHNVGDHDHYCLFYLCKLRNSNNNEITIKHDEVIDYKWLTPEEISNNDKIRDNIKSQLLSAFEIYEKIGKK